MYLSEDDLNYMADEMLEYSRNNVRKAYKKAIKEIVCEESKNG